jgi:glycosyltransferase involved in cell wall biosynthesis
MKIGFDAKRYFHNRTGLGNYSRDLIDGLSDNYPEHRFFLFDEKPEIAHLAHHVVAVAPASQSLLWRVNGMIRDMKRYQLDVFHGLSNELPYGKYPQSLKKLVTIHDVIFRSYPEHYPFIDRTIYHEKTRHALRIADTIIATSKATANDLARFYNADLNKIQVVHQTCGEAHKAFYSDEAIAAFRNSHQLQEPYLLYVSSFQTRKNHLALINAFAALKQTKVKLVLAGRKGETYADCKRLIKNLSLENMVNLIDDIGQENLPLLYRGANAFIYPSLIEGFGIPLLEAAFAGLPMAVNDIAVFREIAPGGTFYFDVNKQESIIISIQGLLQTEKKSNRYAEHLSRFDTVSISKKLMAIYG